jgi:glyoxylase-like metal-dependent hydrolase (beta-lactamase superfamily II)
MMIRIGRSALVLGVFPIALSCAKKERPSDAEPARPVETTPAPVTAPEPALTPASRDVEAPKRLGVEVVTGSSEGFRVNSTILTGERSALLIDAQFTLADARKVANAVAGTNKELTTVYVTHAHPDHYFGFPAIKERFPNARLVALPATVAEIEKTWQAKVNEWRPKYNDAITSTPVVPERITENALDIDGQKVEIVGGVQGDDENNSYLWIPSIRTAIAGDIVFDGIFPWTAETTPDARKAWSETIDRIAANKPDRVVPGHQKSDRKQEPTALVFTKEYLAVYDQELAVSKNAKELESKMKKRYPDAELDVIVKIGSEAAFAKAKGMPASDSTARADTTAAPAPTGADTTVGQRGTGSEPASTAPSPRGTGSEPASTAPSPRGTAREPATTPPSPAP